MARRTLQAKLLADFRASLARWTDPVAYGVGFDGAVFATAHRPSTVASSEHDDPLDYLVVRLSQTDEGPRSFIVQNTWVHARFVQPIQDGALLVDARCNWKRRGPEKNAVATDGQGAILRTFPLGDGIEDVRVTSEGLIWVSYFDEGIFGNRGWSDPGPPAMGATGLVGYDSDGTVRFKFDAAAAGDTISDAYALNVTSDGEVWVYFYTEFPIVRIRAGAYHRWKLGVAGARSMAVRDGQALLVGNDKERSLGRLVSLEGDSGRATEEVVVVDQHGAPLDDAIVYGAGDKLFFFQDRQALVLDDW